MKLLNTLSFAVARLWQQALAVRAMVGALILFQANIALADYDIGGPSSGPFAGLVGFFQDIVNLLEGPGVLMVTFISMVAVVAMWMLMPKQQGLLAWGVRVLSGGIVILNIGTWIVYMRG